ncbi:MAG: dockerin type I repeat-containing protein [Bacteroidaceae bacterium]|nr:dockerin type I repeat-containing protein [Bacteroidaceae bacterium]
MKTKKLFLMAAMLLTSMCAFAQNENNEPLKGDVNGDGKVDVADITAIVKIIMENGSGTDSYYTWYQGLASENQIQNQSYINGLSYNKTTKPTSTVGLSKGYNVFIFPSSWGTPTLYEDEAHTFRWSPYTSQELGITNPSGKNVLVWEAPNPATMFIVWPETYYWYVGTELPTTSSNPSSNITTSNTTANAWHEIGTTLGTYSSTNPLINGSKNNIN